jgi:hypothetical protein
MKLEVRSLKGEGREGKLVSNFTLHLLHFFGELGI